MSEIIEFKTMEEAKAYQKIHGGALSHNVCMGMHIEGALSNFSKKSMHGLIQEDNGAEWTDKMVRDYLKECLAKGWKLLSFGCDNFDHQTGCKGHNIKITIK